MEDASSKKKADLSHTVVEKVSRDEIGNVCQGSESWHRHRVVAQEDKPHQSPEAERYAVERGLHRTLDLRWEGDCRLMWDLLVRKTTPTIVPKGEEREQRDPGCNTFRCMGTNPNAIIRWLSLLCDLYQRLLKAHMDILCGRRVKCSSSLFYWSDESDYSIFL